MQPVLPGSSGGMQGTPLLPLHSPGRNSELDVDRCLPCLQLIALTANLPHTRETCAFSVAVPPNSGHPTSVP